ncbi:hypothetical protein [Microbacterium sp. No. 7]|uniref:hypothetical protein n=1 Tax=Microbacterium sp. No. 7 TaxID=1714373 RepID=UPI0006CFC2BE|nr:hypothetical protein [Microbacterium sp. No. 7]ALJ18911.1 hypothetical protein AOA12_02895 [Microbacterium sp. No. 7]
MTTSEPRRSDTESGGDGAPLRRRRVRESHGTRVRKLADRVPTAWFATIGTALFLAATAAFGGLNTAVADETPVVELSAGETHANDQFSTTVVRALLIDHLSPAGVFADDGKRALVLIVDVENVWDAPQRTIGVLGGFSDTLRIAELGDQKPAGAARMDDQTRDPELQPGLPAQLAFAWQVDADAFAEGDEITIVLHDQTMHTGVLFVEGRSWGDPVERARVTVRLDDAGAPS